MHLHSYDIASGRRSQSTGGGPVWVMRSSSAFTLGRGRQRASRWAPVSHVPELAHTALGALEPQTRTAIKRLGLAVTNRLSVMAGRSWDWNGGRCILCSPWGCFAACPVAPGLRRVGRRLIPERRTCPGWRISMAPAGNARRPRAARAHRCSLHPSWPAHVARLDSRGGSHAHRRSVCEVPRLVAPRWGHSARGPRL